MAEEVDCGANVQYKQGENKLVTKKHEQVL